MTITATILRKLFRHAGKAAIIASTLTLTSCNGMIYDHDDDCDPVYKVRFRYDYNLKKADAFANEVNAVTLYVIDPATGKVVWQKTDDSDAVRQEGYMMDIEGLEPGSYKLLAWAGDGHNGSPHFTMGTGTEDKHLTARINRAGEGLVTADLNRLYKDLDFEYEPREFPKSWGTHVQTVRLMKNTNDIHVVLQHLSGETVDPDLFTYEIEEANGVMDHNNRLTEDETLTYRPWRVRPGLATGFVPDDAEASKFSAAIADFTVGRMMADRKMWLTIRRKPQADKARATDKDDDIVARVPVIDYSLLVKGHYEDMPDQEYLDRQDDYSMVFFLDDEMRWIDAYIYVNAWMVVPPQDTEI